MKYEVLRADMLNINQELMEWVEKGWTPYNGFVTVYPDPMTGKVSGCIMMMKSTTPPKP